MGADSWDLVIAQVYAQSGYQVVVSEINDELLNKGLASINSFLTKSVEKLRYPNRIRKYTLITEPPDLI